MRITFTFPPNYPASSLTLDIERSNSIGNKAKAKLLTVVRGVAHRYSAKSRNSLEACLNCLLGGKIVEPDELSEDEGSGPLAGQQLLTIKGLGEEDSEEEDSDDEDLERLIRNRNCPLPCRAGAVFSPTGRLFTFFPLDPIQHQNAAAHDRRQRSPSPTLGRADKKPRIRLFETFGIIPALEDRERQHGMQDASVADEILNGYEEDSDEVLNLPSLWMNRRVRGSIPLGVCQHVRC